MLREQVLAESSLEYHAILGTENLKLEIKQSTSVHGKDFKKTTWDF